MISNTERCLSYQERQVGLILIAEGKTHSLETYGGMHTHTKGCCKVLKNPNVQRKFVWGGWVFPGLFWIENWKKITKN